MSFQNINRYFLCVGGCHFSGTICFEGDKTKTGHNLFIGKVLNVIGNFEGL